LFFRLVSYRYDRGAIMITTNKSVRDWTELLAGDEVLTTAILDRLLHRSHVLNICGRSYRRRDLEDTLKAATVLSRCLLGHCILAPCSVPSTTLRAGFAGAAMRHHGPHLRARPLSIQAGTSGNRGSTAIDRVRSSATTGGSTNMPQQHCYVGLDVSLEQTSVCVLDEAGAVLWRGRCASEPESIVAALGKYTPGAVRIGLETGLLSTWLFHELKKRDLPVICIDARHAKAALSLWVNKTDTNDAHGIAQIVRVGWYREVVVKSMDNHTLRAMLSARAHLVAQSVTLANSIRGLLKVFGLVVRRAKGGRFDDLVRAAIADQPTAVVAIIEPLLAVLVATREQLAGYEHIVRRRARADTVTRRLMTVPGGWHRGRTRLRLDDRRSRPVQAIIFRGCLPGADAASLSIGRCGSGRTHLPLRERHAAELSVRGRKCPAPSLNAPLQAAQLGTGTDRAKRRAQGRSRRRT
jgi:IstB-like ATP binding protein/Transposase